MIKMITVSINVMKKSADNLKKLKVLESSRAKTNKQTKQEQPGQNHIFQSVFSLGQN